MNKLTNELYTVKEAYRKCVAQMRDLEVNNDELENAERMVASSLHDLEARFNDTLERNAMMEDELRKKGLLEEENQRLKDELQEANEELAVLRDSMNSTRSNARASTPAEASSSVGRRSTDDLQLSDLLARNRPPSRTSSVRPTSRNGMRHTPPMPRVPLPSIPSSSKVRALGSSRAAGHTRTDSRDTTRMDDSVVTSPSSQGLRARQSIGPPTSFRSSMRAPRTTTAITRDRNPPSSSKSMIGDMFARMRALEKRLADTRNGVAINDVSSAIPRPASRLGSSIGPGGNTSVNLTPRRSIDIRRDDAGTPSSIPVPLNKSTSRRPTSRLSTAAGYEGSSHMPSSLRCQTPTMESGATLEFLDQDPSKLRRRSNLSMAAATEAMASGSISQSSRPRGSTLTIGGGFRSGESLRKSANPGTGRPAPPISWKPGMSVNRQRSSSTGSNS